MRATDSGTTMNRAVFTTSRELRVTFDVHTHIVTDRLRTWDLLRLTGYRWESNVVAAKIAERMLLSGSICLHEFEHVLGIARETVVGVDAVSEEDFAPEKILDIRVGLG